MMTATMTESSKLNDPIRDISRNEPWISADTLIDRLIDAGFNLSPIDEAAIRWTCL